MSFAILPQGKPISIITKEEENVNYNQHTSLTYQTDVIFQSFFKSIFPPSPATPNISNKNIKKWYDSILFFPLWTFIYIYRSIVKPKEYEDEQELLLHTNTTDVKNDSKMVQSKKIDSSFLSFHLLSKKRFYSNLIFERYSCSVIKDANGVKQESNCNVLLLDYGKIAMLSTNTTEEEQEIDISYTNDYKNLFKKLDINNNDDDLIHSRIIYLQEKNTCIISWGGLDEYGYVYIYQYIPISKRKDDNIGWKLVSKSYPCSIQINNFITEMIKFDNMYEYMIISRCNGILEILPYSTDSNKKYNSIGMDVSKYHLDISCLDVIPIKSNENKQYYLLVVAGTSCMTNTSIMTFYIIIIDVVTHEILSMEYIHEITFADRYVSFFSGRDNEDVKMMEMNVPILQVTFLNIENTIGILDYYGNVTILNLSYSNDYNEDRNENDDAINSVNIESTMVLSTNYNIIQMIVSNDGKYLSTVSSDATMDIYNLEQEDMYACIFHYSFPNTSVLLLPSISSITSTILLQNNTLQSSKIQYMTNTEAFTFYMNRQEYQSALSILENNDTDKKDVCYQMLWEESFKTKRLNDIYNSLQNYWLYIDNEEYIYTSCMNIEESFHGIHEKDEYRVGYNILNTMYTIAIQKCVNYNVTSIQEKYQKLFIYNKLSLYYNTPFSIQVFNKMLSNANIIQELIVSCAKCGDVMPFMFLILYGYRRISNWMDIYNNLTLDIHPDKYSFIFPIVDEYGTLGFVVKDEITYSPLEVIDYLRQHYPNSKLFDMNDNDIIEEESRIQITIEEKNNIQSFYTQRIIQLVDTTQHLDWIVQQCNISKHRLSYFDNKDILFLDVVEQASSYLQQCLIHGVYSNTLSIREFCDISIKDHVFTLLGNNDTSSLVLQKYTTLVVPILTNLYKVDNDTIQQCVIEYLLHINNTKSYNNQSLWITLSFFEQSRTVLPSKQRIIYSPKELIKLFLQVITIVSNSWKNVKEQIDIIWKCYECLPIRYDISNHDKKDELSLVQDTLDDYYKFWIVIDILSRYTASPPSISYLSQEYQTDKRKLLENDVFPFLLHNFFSSNVSNTTLFQEFLLDIEQIQYCILSDHGNKDEDDTMKSFVLSQILPLVLQYKQWDHVPTLLHHFPQYADHIQSFIFQKLRETFTTFLQSTSISSLQELQQGIIIPMFKDLQSLLLPEYKQMYDDIIRYMSFCYYMLNSVMTNTSIPSSISPFDTFTNNTNKEEILSWMYNMIQKQPNILFHSQEYWLQKEHTIRTCYDILSYRTTTTIKSLSSCHDSWNDFLLPGKNLFELLAYFHVQDDISLSFFIFSVLSKGYEWMAICCAMILMPNIVKFDHPYLDLFWHEVLLLVSRLQDQKEMTAEEKNILLYVCHECLLRCNPINGNDMSPSRNPFIVLDIISNLEKKDVVSNLESISSSSITPQEQQQQHQEQKQDFLVFKVGSLFAKGVTKMLATDDHHRHYPSTTNDLRTEETKDHQIKQQFIVSIPKFPIPIKISSYDSTQYSIQSIIVEFLQHYNLMSSCTSPAIYDYNWIVQYITAITLSLQEIDKISAFLPSQVPSPPPPPPPTVVPKADPSIVQYLEGVGYTRPSAIKCAILTHNQGCSQALEYAIHHDRNRDFTHPLCMVANTMNFLSSRRNEEMWKKQYRHFELVYHANVILREFLIDGVLFMSEHGQPIFNRSIAPLHNGKTLTNIMPPPPQPSTVQPNFANMEFSKQWHLEQFPRDITPSTTKSDAIRTSPHPSSSEASKTQSLSQTLSRTIEPSAIKAPPPPPTPPTSGKNEIKMLEKQPSSQQAANSNAPTTGFSVTKTSKLRTPTQPPPPKGRLNMDFLKKPPERKISSAPSSSSNKTKDVPPPPKSLPPNRLKIDISQFKSKTPTVPASTKQLSMEERRRLAKEGRKLFSKVRQSNMTEEPKIGILQLKNDRVVREKTNPLSSNRPPPPPPVSNTVISTPARKVAHDGWDFDDDASSPTVNGQSEDVKSKNNEMTIKPPPSKLSMTPPPPPPISTTINAKSRTVPDDGWDFDDDVSSPPTPSTNEQAEDILKPKNNGITSKENGVVGDGWGFDGEDSFIPAASSVPNNDGWDFDDF